MGEQQSADRGSTKPIRGVLPGDDLVAAVRAMLLERGEEATGKHLLIARTTAVRIAAGLPCNLPTVEIARQRLGLPSGVP